MLCKSHIQDLLERSFHFFRVYDSRPVGDTLKKPTVEQSISYFMQNRDNMRRAIDSEVDVSRVKDAYIFPGNVDFRMGGFDKLVLLDFKNSQMNKNSPEQIAAFERKLGTYTRIFLLQLTAMGTNFNAIGLKILAMRMPSCVSRMPWNG